MSLINNIKQDNFIKFEEELRQQLNQKSRDSVRETAKTIAGGMFKKIQKDMSNE